MSIAKKDITRNINKKSLISIEDSSILLEKFLLLIKKQAKINRVKLSGFGAFSFKKTPKRVGRNPKTKESYIISERNKLYFNPSSSTKEKLN